MCPLSVLLLELKEEFYNQINYQESIRAGLNMYDICMYGHSKGLVISREADQNNIFSSSLFSIVGIISERHLSFCIEIRLMYIILQIITPQPHHDGVVWRSCCNHRIILCASTASSILLSYCFTHWGPVLLWLVCILVSSKIERYIIRGIVRMDSTMIRQAGSP